MSKVEYLKDMDGNDTVMIDPKQLNTEPEFYAMWNWGQLRDELIRMNKLLNEIKEICNERTIR